MTTLSMILKEKLLGLIAKKAEEANQHVVNPAKDFTRNRKLPFHEVVRILLTIGGNSLGAELLEYFEYRADSATSSAFVQQRGKMKSSALESLFHEFTGTLGMHKTFDGYRLLAFDGTDLHQYFPLVNACSKISSPAESINPITPMVSIPTMTKSVLLYIRAIWII